MDWLKTIAPMIGTALAGPFGGIAASFIADKLGVPDKTVTAVTDLLNSGKMTPDQVSAIRLAEIDFQKFMEDNKIKLEDLSVKNTQGAREMQVATHSHIPGVLALVIVAGFLGILIAMMMGQLKVSDQQALLILLGALASGFGAVLNFYFGSSHGSQNKDILLSQSTPIQHP